MLFLVHTPLKVEKNMASNQMDENGLKCIFLIQLNIFIILYVYDLKRLLCTTPKVSINKGTFENEYVVDPRICFRKCIMYLNKNVAHLHSDGYQI